MKLTGMSFRMDKTRHCFTECIIRLWNSVPQGALVATVLDGFKGALDKFRTEGLSVASSHDGWVVCPDTAAGL